MTIDAQKQLEDRFSKLKSQYSQAQLADAEFLNLEVDRLKLVDILLAYRLMQHIKNVDPSSENQEKLKCVQKEAFKAYPNIEQTSSTEATFINKKDKILMKNRMLAMWASEKFNNWRKPIVLLVAFPFLLFAFYQIIWASPRFESQAKIIVKEPAGMATMDPAMAVMSGFGISSGGTDTELLKFYIYSTDMVMYLENKLSLRQHFSDKNYDFFSRLSDGSSSESLLNYYLKRVTVDIDETSRVVSIHAQGFTPEFAKHLSESVVERAEWYINEIGHKLAKAQLEFVQNEHELVQIKLRNAKTELLEFQRKYDLLDPQAEGAALQQITYRLEAEIAAKRTELMTLRSSMSIDAPLVMQATSELNSMIEQLSSQRNRLATGKSSNTESDELSVGEILAKFSDFRINMELALQSYTSSQISLEKSRIEAYRQLKYLVVVESPTLPEDAKYPNVQYNLALMLVLQLMLFGILKIVLATLKELR
ncbi:lipopolysaccharide biosynthesis protein [Paraglaciecola sp.]|uniref:lipopolysaccharide biosynthesis protein n=1 Tax=Paraglaciecola sp. TaxID=1920173 RepID=UPI00273E5894|nr:lipopolysaccharide biosynthesis protein [Paraglaciecola sp.]MDP5029226.1 lipopolysaccharide biosynthesis protein [Paraglaciecola sp.]